MVIVILHFLGEVAFVVLRQSGKVERILKYRPGEHPRLDYVA
jgi:hypothetical protein